MSGTLYDDLNQSIKGLHKATLGQGEGHIPAPSQRVANPASRNDAGLGGLNVPTLAARVETWGKPQL